MPLGPGHEHLPEKLLRQWEREIERRQERRAQLPRERVALLTRAVEVEAALSDPDVPREARKPLRAELAELREDVSDLRREAERVEEAIAEAQRAWRGAVEAEGCAALARLCDEADKIVDLTGAMPMEQWAREQLPAMQIISALAARWLNSMGETNTAKAVGGFPIFARIPMWARPSAARAGDLIAWATKCTRYQQRLAKQEAAR